MAKEAIVDAHTPEIAMKPGAVPYHWIEGCKRNTPIVILSRSKRFQELQKHEAEGLLEKNNPTRKRGPWEATAFIDEQVMKEATVMFSDPEGNVMTKDTEIALTALKNAREHNPRARQHPLAVPISDEELTKFGIEIRK